MLTITVNALILLAMKIENIDKYPKKVNGVPVEFSIEQPVGTLDALYKADELRDTGLLIGAGLGQIRKRYGSIISVNKKSYWALKLFSRFSRRKNKKNYSVPSMVDLLVGEMKLNYFSKSMNDNMVDFKRDDHDYNDLMRFFKRVYLYDESHISKDDGDYKDLAFFEKGSFEVFIPDLTYHEVPKLRELLIGILEPELFDENEAFSNSPFWESYEGFFDYSIEEDRLKLPSILKTLSETLEGEIRTNIGMAKDDLEFLVKMAEGDRRQKKSLDDLSLFMHMTEQDIKNYIERFNSLLELAPRLGKYI